METRSIALGLITIVAAFAVAFSAGHATGTKTPAAGAGGRAEAIKLASPPAVQGVEVGGVMPGLKSNADKPAAKKRSTTRAATTSRAASPSTSDTTTTPSIPARPATPRQPTKPRAHTPIDGETEDGPITGGGDDG